MAARKPRLLVLTSTFPRWQNDTEPPFVYELCRRMTDDFDITLLAPRAPGSMDREEMDGLHVIRFPYFFRRWENLATHGGGILNRLRTKPLNYLLLPLFLVGQLTALTRLVRRERYQLIHAHWLIPQGLSAVVTRTLANRDMPLVCTSHGGDLYALRGALLKRLKTGIMHRSHLITVVSTAMSEQVLRMGIPRDKIRVIPMGVDLQQRFTPDASANRGNADLLFVGRLVEKKGLDTLLRALPAVITGHPSVRLVIAGGGPLETELRVLAERLGVADRVDFLGLVAQPELPDLYRRATLFVAPFQIADTGDQEGHPVALVEASGCQCPLICGAIPATEDIEHGKTGLRIAPGDSNALAGAIVSLLDDPSLRSRLANAALERCRKSFDWERIAMEYRKELTNLVGQVP
ncbi:MAG: glycosyltransferase family 4 protein [Thiohalocapsa sp.]